MFDVCTTGDTAHIDTIFKFLPHTRANNEVAAMRYEVLTAVLTGTFRRVDRYIVTDVSKVTIYRAFYNVLRDYKHL